MKKKSHLISTVVTIILGVGIIFSLYLVGTKPLNETESVLLGLLLSTSSIMVSWLVTHIYSQISLEETIKLGAESNKENIKNYAVQAAEKVLNLSGELERLSELLSSAIEDSDEASNDKESVMLLQERISAANHNLRTLRSMNDTFLSDWRGVIGDEIDKQQSLEKHISLLAKELEEQKIERDTLKSQMVSPEDLNNIENRISETELRITQNFHELPFKVSASKEKAKKKEALITCPSCSDRIGTKLRLRKGAKKLEQCTSCEQYIQILVVDDEGIQVMTCSNRFTHPVKR